MKQERLTKTESQYKKDLVDSIGKNYEPSQIKDNYSFDDAIEKLKKLEDIEDYYNIELLTLCEYAKCRNCYIKIGTEIKEAFVFNVDLRKKIFRVRTKEKATMVYTFNQHNKEIALTKEELEK